MASKAGLIIGALGCAAAFLAGCAEVVQSEACQRFVACVEARDEAAGTATNMDRYLPGGGCWGGAEGADLCDRSCAKGLSWMRERYADLPAECAP